MSQSNCQAAKRLFALTYRQLSFKHADEAAGWVGRVYKSANLTAEATQTITTDGISGDSNFSYDTSISSRNCNLGQNDEIYAICGKNHNYRKVTPLAKYEPRHHHANQHLFFLKQFHSLLPPLCNTM